jgi:hypothetical protein
MARVVASVGPFASGTRGHKIPTKDAACYLLCLGFVLGRNECSRLELALSLPSSFVIVDARSQCALASLSRPVAFSRDRLTLSPDLAYIHQVTSLRPLLALPRLFTFCFVPRKVPCLAVDAPGIYPLHQLRVHTPPFLLSWDESFFAFALTSRHVLLLRDSPVPSINPETTLQTWPLCYCS